MTPETSLKNAIRRMMKKEFPDLFYRKLSDRYSLGIPDNVVVYHGVTFFYETKVPGKEAAPIQRYTINEILDNGGKAFLFKSVEDARIVLTIIKNKVKWSHVPRQTNQQNNLSQISKAILTPTEDVGNVENIILKREVS